MTLGLWNCWSCLSLFFFSSRRRHTRWNCDWSSDVCSSDLLPNSSTEQELGKPVGSDLRQGTITLPVILLRDRSEERRVGKECRSRWSPNPHKNKEEPYFHARATMAVDCARNQWQYRLCMS